MTAYVVETEPVAKALSGGVEMIEPIAEEWRALCAEGPCDQPFFRPEWIAAYARAFAPEKKLLLVTARVGGRLRAVLSLVEEWALLRQYIQPGKGLRSWSRKRCR